MTQEQVVLREIDTAIRNMPCEIEESILEMADHIRRMVEVAGDPVGPMALALAGARLAAK